MAMDRAVWRRWVVGWVAVPAVAGLAVVMGCGDDEEEGPEKVAQVERACEEGIAGGELWVEREISSLGPSANEMVSDGEGLWVVESGANRVSRFDLQEQQMESGALDVGSERNPYDTVIDGEGRLWVSNFLADTVSVFDIEERALIEEIDFEGFENPSSLAVEGGQIYVGSVNYQGSEGFGEGAVARIDGERLEVVEEVSTTFKNPHFMEVVEWGGRPHLVVSSSAGIDQSGDRVEVDGPGGIELFELDEVGEQPLSGQAYEVGQEAARVVGAPGRAWLSEADQRLYMTSGIAPAIFVFDMAQRQWIYDAQSPIWLFEGADEVGDATHRAAMDDEGVLWITAFNEDKLYLLDTACRAVLGDPIDLGKSAHMLEGSQAIEVIEGDERREVYYARSIANVMGRLLFYPTGDDDE